MPVAVGVLRQGLCVHLRPLFLLLLTCALCRRWLRVCTSGDIWRLRFDEKLPASVLQRLEGAQVCVQPLGVHAVPGPADNCMILLRWDAQAHIRATSWVWSSCLWHSKSYLALVHPCVEKLFCCAAWESCCRLFVPRSLVRAHSW